MQKIKILQFPIANSFGGITHYALNNWKWMDKSRFQCDFATMSESLDFANQILKTGSRIHYLSCYAEEDRPLFIKEFNRILDSGYDIVHLHTKQWKSFLVEELCKEHETPKVIVHSHSTRCDNNDDSKREKETEEHYRIRSLIDENLATDFWACSQEASDWLFGNRIPPCRIKIMKNAIETELFLFDEQTRFQLRREFHLEDKFVIGNVGRMCYPKAQLFLIQAFAAALNRRKDLVLVIVGDGELRPKLEATARQLGVIDRILLLGKRNDVNRLYQMMDLFALSSNFEGNPITAIEAQASGLRVLLSDAITRDADITGNVAYLPLEKDAWSEAFVSAAFLERRNMHPQIMASGYDASSQIKEIEKEYLAFPMKNNG